MLFRSKGPEVLEQEGQDFLAHFENLLDTVEVVAISGSLPAGLPVDYYANLVDLVNQAGKPVVLDCSGAALQAVLESPHKPIRLNHGFVAGHFLHPGLLATDHEMRASSSMSSSWMGLETRAGCRVCGVLPIGWTPAQSKHRSNQNHRMLSTSTFHVHQACINGAYSQPSLRLAMQIPAS